MRAIHLAELDKLRPILVLTRAVAVPVMASITVAPITTTIRGYSTEVPVGPDNGLREHSVINCAAIQTIPVEQLRHQIGWLHIAQERQLTEAIHAAFDLL
jgi:mRNA interferase MazF